MAAIILLPTIWESDIGNTTRVMVWVCAASGHSLHKVQPISFALLKLWPSQKGSESTWGYEEHGTRRNYPGCFTTEQEPMAVTSKF